MDGSGLGVLVIGLVLCFSGVRSLNLAVAASGFAVGWLLAEPLGASVLTAFLVAVGACALGGAGLALSGLGRTFPGALEFLRHPQLPWHALVTAVAWLALAWAGWTVQRRTMRNRQESRDRPGR